jgi:hypothetical protein
LLRVIRCMPPASSSSHQHSSRTKKKKWQCTCTPGRSLGLKGQQQRQQVCRVHVCVPFSPGRGARPSECVVRQTSCGSCEHDVRKRAGTVNWRARMCFPGTQLLPRLRHPSLSETRSDLCAPKAR